MRICCLCDELSKYRVEYRNGSSEQFCDGHILLAGVDVIKAVHVIEESDKETPCEKLAM